MKQGKMMMWDNEIDEGKIIQISLDYRDWEILKDVLEAHQEYLQDLENDGDLDDHDELWRINGMVDFINNTEIEEEEDDL